MSQSSQSANASSGGGKYETRTMNGDRPLSLRDPLLRNMVNLTREAMKNRLLKEMTCQEPLDDNRQFLRPRIDTPSNSDPFILKRVQSTNGGLTSSGSQVRIVFENKGAELPSGFKYHFSRQAAEEFLNHLEMKTQPTCWTSSPLGRQQFHWDVGTSELTGSAKGTANGTTALVIASSPKVKMTLVLEQGARESRFLPRTESTSCQHVSFSLFQWAATEEVIDRRDSCTKATHILSPQKAGL
jgi:hypothetical protein